MPKAPLPARYPPLADSADGAKIHRKAAHKSQVLREAPLATRGVGGESADLTKDREWHQEVRSVWVDDRWHVGQRVVAEGHAPNDDPVAVPGRSVSKSHLTPGYRVTPRRG